MQRLTAAGQTMSRITSAVQRLTAAGQTVAIAESSAGGFISATLLAQPGASKFYAGGVVCYTKAAKAVIGLDAASSKPTSTEPHAVELAEAARATLGADWGIGETGVRDHPSRQSPCPIAS